MADRRGEKQVDYKSARVGVLTNQVYKDNYEVDDSFSENTSPDPLNVRNTDELARLLESNPNVDIDARVIGVRGGSRRMGKAEFLEAYKNGDTRLREAGYDAFAYDGEYTTGGVGSDFIPLLGGPFFKQLYLYDYLKMNAASFQAYHHDPIARAIVQIQRDFCMGGGWRCDFKNPLHKALWEAFEHANDLRNMFDIIALEHPIQGETMIWKLPNMYANIGLRLGQNQKVPQGAIPRVRIIDPSAIWEVVTWPEDITKVLSYVMVTPTQYQIYTGTDSNGYRVPTSKFLYQHIPAEQVLHFKSNVLSGEKRGRSDLFPVLGYLKRLRDTVQYSILSAQKQAAWSIDTTIEGNQTDIDSYMSSQIALGTIPPAGSEFVHSAKIKREYLSNSQGRAGNSEAFEWCLSMICAGTKTPVNYLGTHLSGGQTKASAMIATEPTTKHFEKRRKVYEDMLQKMAEHLFHTFGIEDWEMEVTFPDLVTADRSAKLKDLSLAVQEGWLSRERAANMAAKELDITEFDYATEKKLIEEDRSEDEYLLPLSNAGLETGTGFADSPSVPEPTGVSSQDRKDERSAATK